MANIITEPSNTNPGTADWQQLLYKLTNTAAGLLNIGFNQTARQVLSGSKLEVNGSYYAVSGNEGIVNYSNITVRRFFYIYAVPASNGATCSFNCLTAQPVFRGERGGWYHQSDNSRAVILAYKNNSSSVYSWALITGDELPWEKCAPDINDTLTQLGNITGPIYTASPGWYKAELAGGGGAGGRTNTTGAGGTGGTGGYVRHLFFIKNTANIRLLIGARGNTGATDTGGGGGGGSVIETPDEIIIAAGGGGGAGGTVNARNGGGGGGGYGSGGGGGGDTSGSNTYTGGSGGDTGTAFAGGAGGNGTPGLPGRGISAGGGGNNVSGNGAGGYGGAMFGGPGNGGGGDGGSAVGGTLNGGNGGNNKDTVIGGGGNGGAVNANGGNGYIRLYKYE